MPAKKTANRKKRIAPATSISEARGGPLTLGEARALLDARSAPGAAPVAARRRSRAATATAPMAGEGAEPASVASVALEQQALRATRELERERRLNEYEALIDLLEQHGVASPAMPTASTSTGRRRASATRTQVEALRLVAEGDSWFDYPVPFFGGGVVPRLEDRIGLPILNMAEAGDEVRFMLGTKQRSELAHRLRTGAPGGARWDALLFSGGGNDLTDNPMALWIKQFDAGASADDHIDSNRLGFALDLVRAGYEDVIALRDSLSPETHLFFHTYDFAIPDGRGVCGKGPWLKPTFDYRGFEDVQFAGKVVEAMLKRFADLVETFASRTVTVVPTQGTLSATARSWHNELHPSRRGFDSIAEKFEAALRGVFAE